MQTLILKAESYLPDLSYYKCYENRNIVFQFWYV